MKMQSIYVKEINEKLIANSLKIDAPKDLLPLINESNDSAYPFIEVDSFGTMFFVIRERGEEIERRITTNLEDLLYWVFSGITFTMACKYELDNRIEEQDSRILIFKKQTELLNAINENWASKEKWFI